MYSMYLGHRETASGGKERSRRAQEGYRHGPITELSRWGRSTQDLLATLNDLHSWGVSVMAPNGLAFDLATSTGKLMCTIMAGIATFERDLIRKRVKSGLAAARG